MQNDKVSALYVRRDSIYKSLLHDCWDIDRDARLWPGGNPCIAHPPCGQWGKLRMFARVDDAEKQLAVLALQQVRENGGVLEHPRHSTLWPFLNLPYPGTVDIFGGFSLCVDQSWWGHRARKNTLLYFFGCKQKDLPPIPIRFDAITHVISSSKKRYSDGRVSKEIGSKQRDKTPVEMANWLIAAAQICKH